MKFSALGLILYFTLSYNDGTDVLCILIELDYAY